MKSTSPTLLPILRSRTHGELLAWLYLNPGRKESLSDLASLLGVSTPTVLRIANQLTAAGLLVEERRGRSRLLAAATSTLLYQPLTQVLALTFGPLPVLAALMHPIAGVEEAYIFGSWASRYAGIAGPPPDDVDVLVVGTADVDQLHEVGRAGSERLGRDVNVHQVSRSAWCSDHHPDPFVALVRDRPMVRLEIEAAP